MSLETAIITYFVIGTIVLFLILGGTSTNVKENEEN